MSTASQEMNWGSLVLATVILGGMGLVFVGGAFEVANKAGFGWAFLGAASIGLGVWGALLGLYWLHWRAAKLRAAQRREPWRQPKKGGFLLGAGLGFAALIVLQAGAMFAVMPSGEGLPEDLRVAALYVAFSPFIGIAYLVVPLVTGWVWRVVRATSLT